MVISEKILCLFLSNWNFFLIPVYTNHDIEKDNDGMPSSATKVPLTITSPRCPLDRLQTNLVDTFMTSGGLCETAFLELNDPSTGLGSSYLEFKQPMVGHCFDREIQRATDLYGCSYKPSQGKCYLSDTIGVCSLDILQGVRQGNLHLQHYIFFT